jgi:DNA-binding GntR family transcriptional regulator
MSLTNRLTDGTAQSLAEKAYLYLRRKILSGELPAGIPLSEASIARELGNSRTPLREAIRRLAAEGFLRHIPNRGSMVVEFSKRDIAELYELREALETYAVGKAAEHTLRPPDLDTLQRLVSDVLSLRDELVQSGEPRLKPEQMQRFIQTDLRFHTMLVRAAANRRTLKVFADTRVLLDIFTMRRQGHDVAQLADIHRYHSEVLAAVVRKDSETAMRLLGQHIQVSKQERLREYDEWEHEIAVSHPAPSLAGLVP